MFIQITCIPLRLLGRRHKLSPSIINRLSPSTGLEGDFVCGPKGAEIGQGHWENVIVQSNLQACGIESQACNTDPKKGTVNETKIPSAKETEAGKLTKALNNNAPLT